MSDSRSVSILIVSFNTRDLTLECLESVAAHCPEAEVIVVDNGSTDGSAEAIREQHRDVELIAVDDNLGFAAANNVAYERSHGEYVVLLNSDTVLNDDALQRCVSQLDADSELGAVHPRLVGRDGKPQESCHRMPTLSEIARRAIWLPPKHTDQNEYWLAGTALVLRRTAIEDAGGLFDWTFYFYWEDCDLSARLRSVGYRLAVCDDAEITHLGGASGGGPDATRRPDLAARYLFGKHAWFAKNRPWWQSKALWWLDAFDVVRCFARGMVRPSRRHEVAHARLFADVLKKRLLRQSLPKFAGKPATVVEKPIDVPAAHSRVAAVVIGRNEGHRLVACLESLVSEVGHIIYVDSGSTDGSCDVARSLNAEVVSLDMSQPFTAARARNAGLARVRDEEYVFFVDGDCRVEPGFIADGASVLDTHPTVSTYCGIRREIEPHASVYNNLCDLEWQRPGGFVDACGGDAVFRVEPLRLVGGYDESLIAGEEPELCLRLRRRGWRILRMPTAMTYHDASMTAWSQWWRRAVRAGHAYAEGFHLHSDSDGFRAKEMLSIGWYAALLPAVGLVAAWPTGGWSLAFVLASYLLLFTRVTKRAQGNGLSLKLASTVGVFTVAAKFAHLAGAATYFMNHFLERRTSLIEYKGPGAETPDTKRLAYLTSEYPRPSHTFIRREIVALEELGWEIERFSVRPLGGCKLADPGDISEAEKTFMILGRSPLTLAWSLLRTVVSRPMRFAAAVAMTLRLSRTSHRGLLRHFAYLAEACVMLPEMAARGVAHVHVHFGKNAADVAWMLKILGGPTFSMTVHGPGEFDAPGPYALGPKVAASEFTVAISSFGTGQLRRWVPVDHWDKLHVVHCTIGDDFLSQRSDVPADASRFVCVGRLTPQKGQLLLLDAVAKLVANGVDARVTFVGDGELRESIERKVRDEGLEDHVEITGFVGEAEVRKRLNNCRAMVLPSFAEGLPVAIMEAFALGRPVVSTAIAGIPELVVDGKNGWVVTSGSVDALAAALQEATNASTETLTQMGRDGHARVLVQHRSITEATRLSNLLTTSTAAQPSQPVEVVRPDVQFSKQPQPLSTASISTT